MPVRNRTYTTARVKADLGDEEEDFGEIVVQRAQTVNAVEDILKARYGEHKVGTTYLIDGVVVNATDSRRDLLVQLFYEESNQSGLRRVEDSLRLV